MDKKTFDMVMAFFNKTNDLYFELEKEVGSEKAESLLDDLTNYTESLLKVGKHLDKENYVNKEGFLKVKHDGFPRYTKLDVIYEYDNSMSLCETTSGLVLLVPNEQISFEKL